MQGGGVGVVHHAPSEYEYGILQGHDPDFKYGAAHPAHDVGFDAGTIEEGEARSAIETLKKDKENRKSGFMNQIMFWRSTQPPEDPVRRS